MAKTVNPQQDTGWGVIYRLNNLFSEVELLAPSGKYDEWNIKLDRIWSNLVYRNYLEWETDENKKIIGVNYSTDDFEKKNFLDDQILKAKSKLSAAKKKMKVEDSFSYEWVKAKRKLYQALLIKEVWLKKYMYQLGLYLKETEHNPAGSMWGK